MKILVRKKTTTAAPDGLRRAEAAEASEEDAVEVPGSTIALLSGLLTLILTFANGVSPLIKYWIIEAPTEDVKIELEKAKTDLERAKTELEKMKSESEKAKMTSEQGNHKLELLKQALQSANQQERASFLKLLITTDLLKDDNGELSKMINNPATIPHLPTPTPTTKQTPNKP